MSSEKAIENAALRATFGPRGLTSLTLLAAAAATVHVANDAFTLSINGGPEIKSAALPAPTVARKSPSELSFLYTTPSSTVRATYSFHGTSAAFITKTLSVTSSAHGAAPHNATNVSIFSGTALLMGAAPPDSSYVARSHFGLGDYALFARWPQAKLGALLTVQNPYLAAHLDAASGEATISYSPQMAWPASGTFVADAAHLGLHVLTNRTLAPPADPIDASEHEAMLECVRSAIAAPARNSTVKINVGWTENDFQIDISTAEGRAEYKRLIDRASELGLTHILFAPRNSDVSRCMRTYIHAHMPQPSPV